MSEHPAEAPNQDSSKENALVDRLKEIQELVKEDRSLIRRGSRVNSELLLCIGRTRSYVTIEAGDVTKIDAKPQRMRSVDFIISGPALAWSNYWEPMPRPGWHDLFAMNKRGELFIEGTLLIFMQNLQYFKDLLALPRRSTRIVHDA